VTRSSGSQVHGVSLDLVNLRSETYTQDSRIPGAIQFGTPEQVCSHFRHRRAAGKQTRRTLRSGPITSSRQLRQASSQQPLDPQGRAAAAGAAAEAAACSNAVADVTRELHVQDALQQQDLTACAAA
jgi:hypothetical protein